jgi:MFS family permease
VRQATTLTRAWVYVFPSFYLHGAGFTGFVVAAARLGCAVGALLAGKPADRVGCIRMTCSPRCG